MKKTLLILAAGMGSRFGGLKQIEGVGPNNEFIIDYSIYDAIKAGFNKVVFIIKEENYEVFKETIGKRVEPHIETEYVFQKNDNLPKEYQELLKDREKPLGTSHAILCAKDKIHEPFAIINADDFYGFDAYRVSMQYLEKINPKRYGLVAYHLGNTLPGNGKAKRGICIADENDKLVNLIESKVELQGDMIEASPLSGATPFMTDKETLVAMNLFAFTPELFDILEVQLKEFLDKNKDNLDSCEFLITDSLNKLVEDKEIVVDVLYTTAVWYGLTYKEDLNELKEAIDKMIKNGEYPQNLWED